MKDGKAPNNGEGIMDLGHNERNGAASSAVKNTISAADAVTTAEGGGDKLRERRSISASPRLQVRMMSTLKEENDEEEEGEEEGEEEEDGNVDWYPPRIVTEVESRL